MYLYCRGRIEICKGDITELTVDAIVNAANSSLLGGGGVDGAIHRAAGPKLVEECRAIGGAATGDVAVTRGYELPAQYVFHAVGPVWRGGSSGEDFLLASCYLRSMSLAAERGIRTIAFPAISTGAYGFPLERATDIAIGSVKSALSETDQIDKVVFCCFSDDDLATYRSVADLLL